VFLELEKNFEFVDSNNFKTLLPIQHFELYLHPLSGELCLLMANELKN